MKSLNVHDGLSEATKAALVDAANLVTDGLDQHELIVMRHRDHALIQQLEKDCTALRQENAQIKQSLKMVRRAGQLFKDALDEQDFEFVALATRCGNCGHPEHIANSEVCPICSNEQILGVRRIEDCCAAYVRSV